MPLIRYTKAPPPPPEPGERSYWAYFPKNTVRRVVLLLVALGVVLFLRSSGGSTFGSLFDKISPRRAAPSSRADSAPVYHIKVTRPEGAPAEPNSP
ncbi:MAG TPA: hypothetical protein VHJ20_07455 [Polyangia bacterium]|nr:hypothetical protein [Polyangia bacterium]